MFGEEAEMAKTAGNGDLDIGPVENRNDGGRTSDPATGLIHTELHFYEVV